MSGRSVIDMALCVFVRQGEGKRRSLPVRYPNGSVYPSVLVKCDAQGGVRTRHLGLER